MIHRVTKRFRSAAFFDAFLIHDFVFGEHLEGQFTFAYIITIVDDRKFPDIDDCGS